jgi:hypothetical protein
MRLAAVRRVLSATTGSLGALALLELVAWGSIASGSLEALPPDYAAAAAGIRRDPDLGIWRVPHARLREHTPCWDVTYQTNSAGARDIERTRRSSDFRVVVLGDALLEGRGLAPEQRLTDRLERVTGYEHLNFAFGAGGLEARERAYRVLARDYDHSAVLVGVTPALDLGDPASVDPPVWRRELQRRTWGWNALEALAGRSPAHLPAPAADAQGRERSLFYDFSEDRAGALADALARLREASAPRLLAVVLLPTFADLLRHDESGSDPLSSRLRELAGETGIRVVSLLPHMAAHGPRYQRYFSACDEVHWNAYGNAVALDYLREALRGGFYPEEAAEQGES